MAPADALDRSSPALPSLSALERYALALAFVGLATVARLLSAPFLAGQAPFAFHFVAVIAAAWLAGFDGGVVATLAGAAAADYFFTSPHFSLRTMRPENTAALALFIGLSLFLSWLISRWRSAERDARAASVRSRQRVEQLEFQGTLLDHAYDAIFVRDVEARITLWNTGAERIYGWTAAEAIGRNAHELVGTASDTRATLTKELERGSWSGRLLHRHRDGREVISESRQVRLPSGDVLEVNRDVSDRARVERELVASQQLLRTTLDNFPTAIAYKNAEGRFIDVNPAAERALGLTKNAILGRRIGDFIPADAAALLEQHDSEVMATRLPQQFENLTPLPDGTRHYLDTNFPLVNADGVVYGTGHISHDITSIKRAQDALRDSEQTMTALMNASTESIWLLDKERVLVANATAASRLGLSVEQLVGARWRTLFPDYVSTRRGEKVEQVFASGKPLRFEDERGGIRFDHSFYPARDADGRVIAVAAFSRDVTEQRRHEDELRAMSQRLSYHVSHSPLAVIEFGPEMRVTRWTGAAERLFGWSEDEVVGKRFGDFRWIHEDDLAAVTATAAALESGHDPRRFSTNRNYRKDGTIVHCEWYNSSLVDGAGQLRSVLSLVLDVTERNRLEHELRSQAHELATANRLKDDFLATLSHELRTPINAILGWAQILTMSEFSEERLARGLDTITRNARLQTRMVEDLLDISRIVTGSVRLELQAVDLETLTEQALDVVRPAADAKQLVLAAQIEPGLSLNADPHRLQQVLWNLLSNATKFTPPGGHISLSARTSGATVEISVTDTGLGIPAAFLPHVFERFRQGDSSPTRQHGGLGLGLAIVRHIIELHGGVVDARSEGVGHGAVFTVRLPASPPDSERPRPPQHPPASDQRPLESMRLLVVDDEPDARDMLATLLAAAGAVVDAAESAAAAFARIEQLVPDVVLSDVAMPGTDGYQFIRELRRSHSPAQRVLAIALSAYGGATARDAALAAGFDRFLAKPVDADALIATIAGLRTRS